MLNVGVIGCGAISKMHIDSFCQMQDTQVVAIADKNVELGKKVASELGADFYEDYKEMLKRDDIQAIDICTPSGLHGEAAVEAANAGKHVIVEKPLDVTLEKIDAIVKACDENKVKLNCIFNNRYREGNIFFKKAIDSGRFGKLINCNANVRWYREPDYYLKSSWHGTVKLDGGGALMNQSIHYVDLLLWFAGDVATLKAYVGTLLHKTIETEDTAVASLKFVSGALGSIVATTSTYPGFPAEIQIVGERGSASISDGEIKQWNFIDEDPLDEEAKQYMSSATEVDNKRASDPMAFNNYYHKCQLEKAVASILQDTKPEVGGYEARKSVELILGIYESSRTGNEIKL